MNLLRLGARVISSNCKELAFPYRLTFAVTSQCQARCVMCGIWHKPLEQELRLDEISTLFSKADRFSWINLTGGEIFQRRDINDILMTVVTRSRHLYLLNFPTNGIQTEEIITAVKMLQQESNLPRLIVSVSIDGSPAVHDTIRGVQGCWNQAITTYKHLRKIQTRQFSVFIGHTLQTANADNFDAMFNACRAEIPELRIDDFHINIAHTSGIYYNNTDLSLLPEQNKVFHLINRLSMGRSLKLLSPVAFVEREYLRHIKRYLSGVKSPLGCQAAAASCFINPAGIVYPCTSFDSPIGSLREHEMDLYRLWQSAERLGTRAAVKQNNCPGCWTPCEAYQTILANLSRTISPK